jgi:hypothetical protein
VTPRAPPCHRSVAGGIRVKVVEVVGGIVTGRRRQEFGVGGTMVGGGRGTVGTAGEVVISGVPEKEAQVARNRRQRSGRWGGGTGREEEGGICKCSFIYLLVGAGLTAH